MSTTLTTTTSHTDATVVAVYHPRLYTHVKSIFDAVFLSAYGFWMETRGVPPKATELASTLQSSPSTAARAIKRLTEAGHLVEGKLSRAVLNRLKAPQARIPVFAEYLERVGGWHHLTAAILLQHVSYCDALKRATAGPAPEEEWSNGSEPVNPKLALATISRELAWCERTVRNARDWLKGLGLLLIRRAGRFCRWALGFARGSGPAAGSARLPAATITIHSLPHLTEDDVSLHHTLQEEEKMTQKEEPQEPLGTKPQSEPAPAAPAPEPKADLGPETTLKAQLEALFASAFKSCERDAANVIVEAARAHEIPPERALAYTEKRIEENQARATPLKNALSAARFFAQDMKEDLLERPVESRPRQAPAPAQPTHMYYEFNYQREEPTHAPVQEDVTPFDPPQMMDAPVRPARRRLQIPKPSGEGDPSIEDPAGLLERWHLIPDLNKAVYQSAAKRRATKLILTIKELAAHVDPFHQALGSYFYKINETKKMQDFIEELKRKMEVEEDKFVNKQRAILIERTEEDITTFQQQCAEEQGRLHDNYHEVIERIRNFRNNGPTEKEVLWTEIVRPGAAKGMQRLALLGEVEFDNFWTEYSKFKPAIDMIRNLRLEGIDQ